MKKYLWLMMSVVMVTCTAKGSDEKYADKVATLDSTIKTIYSVISGDKGVERDWELFRYLFKPGARLIPSGKAQDGTVGMRVLTPEQYIETSGPFLVDNGFHEIEIGRKVNEYGTIAQVFSTYAAKRNKEDAEPFMRGINSIQLLKDNDRWWVVSIFWMAETEEFPLPADAID